MWIIKAVMITNWEPKILIVIDILMHKSEVSNSNRNMNYAGMYYVHSRVGVFNQVPKWTCNAVN